MNIAAMAIRCKTITLVATVLIAVGGAVLYGRLGRLEDPEFTIKEAQVFTLYPGAAAMEVAEEVTDKIETAIQQMGQLKRITSISEPGRSTIRVVIKDNYDKSSLPQVWDELRRKVNDMQVDLPPGASRSIVNDDFGDVFGVLYAVHGDGYSYAELKRHVDTLRRELLLVTDVGKITIFGDQQEVVYVEISRARTARLGISPETILASLKGQNLVAAAGVVEVGSRYIRIEPTGQFTSVDQIGDLLILQEDAKASRLYLRDVATIKRGYIDPPTALMRYNGRPAIGLGVSTVAGGNVVTMGDGLTQRLAELAVQTPIGIEIGVIALQSEAVTAAIDGFIVSLAEALLIVIGVLMFAMGFRSGILIGVILLLTVLATFIVMYMWGIMLERISLGALIIALGMLVDNAIVVVDGILVNLKRGMSRLKAVEQIVGQTMWPLFGATIVAILAFAAIGMSQDSTGEYCRSLFQVMLVALMMSWILAITVTPLLGMMFLKDAAGDADADPYGGIFFSMYRGVLGACIRFRWVTVAVLIGMLVLAVIGFGYVDRSFFPDATRPQFMVHYWLPQGTHITRTEADMQTIVEHLLKMDEIPAVSAFVGQGAPRFLLTFTPEEANSAYGLLLVSVNDIKQIDSVIPTIDEYLAESFPGALAYCRKFVLGPGEANKIQARFRGSDPDTLRGLAQEAKAIIRAEPTATDLQDDWRQRVPLIRPIIADAQARNAGVTRSNIAYALQMAFNGVRIGTYREADYLHPIIVRGPDDERSDIDNIHSVHMWSPVAKRGMPIRQFMLGFESSSENDIIRRRNRLPTLTVKCDPSVGQATTLLTKLKPKIEAITLPPGYSMEWGGEYEDSGDAQAALAGSIPATAILMMLVVIVLFNALRQPMIIFMTVPLAIIGVTAGLLVTHQPFGFMALLGMLSLVGMLIKNAVVLIDEIDARMGAGGPRDQALMLAAVSRLRPVSMAALTTVLGMIPLLPDAFFVAMAVTIIFGLAFATVLTMIVVPVLYAIFFRIRCAA